MNRVREYIKFAVCFSGLGYIVLWPLTAHDALHLSPGLHLAGMTSSAWVLFTLVLRPLRRRFRGRAVKPIPSPLARLRLGKKRAPPPPRRYVQPRSHFGLRNAPH
ncbi:MAG: hypothetical protein Q8M24_17485 [Pseudolabrys sp.]|nr:hypothetical protein [Pseudolabrys sp.]MDP2297240.1 hypothetical protein [Pseudolabrys sp.]